MSANILIVDDEEDIRNLIQGILEDEGYEITVAKNSDETYARVKEKRPSMVVLDIWLQGSKDDGLGILKTLKSEHPDMPIVMISGHGTIETAVSAIRDGAYDFIEKPFKSDRLLLMIRRALENAKLLKENAILKKQSTGTDVYLIGESPQIQNIQQIIERVAPTNSRVLLSGEPGTGKDIVARLLHKNSARSEEAFIVVNCATLRPERFEVELFGCADGAYKGEPGQIGFLEQAHKGTLLLDEVSDMPLETQGKIVRVLQEQKFQKIGSGEKIEVDVRVLASTNRNLLTLMNEGLFRQDLYYRLNVVPIDMPALRDRSQDIPALCSFFLSLFFEQLGAAQKSFSIEALNVLKKYNWPGNIRQLRNVIEWVVIMNAKQNLECFDVENLPPEFSGLLPSAENAVSLIIDENYLSLPLREAREVFEREYLLAQVNKFDGNVSKTAHFVGMERSALHRKLKTLQVVSDKEEEQENDNFNDKKRA
jgi:two-component system nitrogen regulation response regulator NtrX